MYFLFKIDQYYAQKKKTLNSWLFFWAEEGISSYLTVDGCVLLQLALRDRPLL